MDRVLTPSELRQAVDEATDLNMDECLGDEVLLTLCVLAWPTRAAQDN